MKQLSRNETALLPCPFCGGKATVWHSHIDHEWSAACEGECGTEHGENYATEEQQIAAWNRRCIPSETTPTVKRRAAEVSAKLVTTNARMANMADEENTTLAGTVDEMHRAVVETTDFLRSLFTETGDKDG